MKPHPLSTVAQGLAGLFVLAVGFAACSSPANEPLGYPQGPNNNPPGTDSGSGPGTEGGPPAPMGDAGHQGTGMCTPADLVQQAQCGAGQACDVDRSAPPPPPPHDAGMNEGGGGKDGGGKEGGGGGDGGGNGGDGGGGGPGIGNESVVCRKATTTGTEGAACSASDPTTCAVGLTCVALNAASAVCQKFCTADATCTAPGGACRKTTLDVAQVLTAKTCSLTCDPLTAKGCGAAQNCDLRLSDDKTRLFTDCIAAGTGGQASPCTKAEDCKQGYSCLKLEQNGQVIAQECLQSCTLSPTQSACSANTTCTQINPPNTLAGTQYGWCY